MHSNSFFIHAVIDYAPMDEWDGAPAAGFEPAPTSREEKSQTLDHSGAQCSLISVALEFKAGVRFKKR